MDECFICGITGEQTRLFDAISKEGIVKICKECSFKEDIPVIKRPTTFQLKEEERRQTVYERLSKAAGIEKKEQKTVQLEKQETSLRDIVEKNLEKKFGRHEKFGKKEPRLDLVDNFHWSIMTSRRRKKISQAQLAEAIAESESVIRMAEKGILPEDDYTLINKLENYLEIKLIRKEIEKIIQEKKPEISKVNLASPENLTIADLKEMRRIREEELMQRNEERRLIEENSDKEFEAESVNKRAEFAGKENKKELSDEDIRGLIFRK